MALDEDERTVLDADERTAELLERDGVADERTADEERDGVVEVLTLLLLRVALVREGAAVR